MSSPRLRRLTLDHERMESRFRDWQPIRITAAAGQPPERYQVTYNVQGLYSTPAGQILERNEHVMEVNLSLGYPRRAPQCKMLTPVFHPNFDEASVCIGDFWAASEGLDDLIIRIGRMIAYQEYNIKSPLNGLAAKWAAQHAHLLPVDRTEVAPPSAPVVDEAVEKLVISVTEETPSNVASVATPPPIPDVRPAAVLPPTLSQFQVPHSPPNVANFSTPTPVPDVRPPAAVSAFARLDFGMIAVALRPSRTTVGRAPDNDIQLIHDSVSDHHAELVRCEAGAIIRDLSSARGCLINGSTIHRALLVPEDKVCFGDLEAIFLTGDKKPPLQDLY